MSVKLKTSDFDLSCRNSQQLSPQAMNCKKSGFEIEYFCENKYLKLALNIVVIVKEFLFRLF